LGQQDGQSGSLVTVIAAPPALQPFAAACVQFDPPVDRHDPALHSQPAKAKPEFPPPPMHTRVGSLIWAQPPPPLPEPVMFGASVEAL
jgi:hypothetical protein